MVGGGQDGERLAEAFAQAELPRGTNGVLITGPFMPATVQARLDRLAARQTRFRVCGFLAEPANLLKRADVVIAMGGYNTVSEILSFEKPSLIVPRVHPRQEQLIRCQRLRDLGLVDMLHPDQLRPQTLSRWLASEYFPRRSIRTCLDFHGLSRLPRLLDEVLAKPVASGECDQRTFSPRQPAVSATR
jgi:predicted glycosyltransferase